MTSVSDAVRKRCPRAFEPGPQLAEVVDLAVENDRDAAVLVEDRLVAARQVDDRQPPHPERDRSVDEIACIVGAAMRHRIAHADDVRLRGGRAAQTDDPGDAAHQADDLEQLADLALVDRS